MVTEHGQKPIEEIAKGDSVWSCDRATGDWYLCRVVETYVNEYVGNQIATFVAGECIKSTYHHPYWVVRGKNLDGRPTPEHVAAAMAEEGTIPGRWVDAGDLLVGDILLLRDGRQVPIEAIESKLVVDQIYNFAVEPAHNYAVGHVGVLVHNNCAASNNPNLKNVDLSKLIPPESRPYADPGKLQRHGPFDWNKYTPITVETDGARYFIMDGMTRVANALRAGIKELPAMIFPRS